MTAYFIGTPGERPRLLTMQEGEALAVARSGEVIIPADHIADWVISADGHSLTAWVPPLGVAKLDLWEAVKIRRETIIAGGLEIDGIGRFDTDEISRSNVSGAAIAAQAALAAGAPFEVEWTLADNSRVSLSAVQMIDVHVAGVVFINHAHARAASLRTMIEAATSLHELGEIDIDAGWP